jgi:hypothetical protein
MGGGASAPHRVAYRDPTGRSHRRRREELSMTTLKTVRSYARYALASLAAVAFLIAAN